MNIIQLLYMDENLNNITKMYDKLTYFDQYGGSLILFVIITIIVILLLSYFHTMANVQPIIDDWPNQRCKPTIIPFAGLITHPEGMSASEYTAQNFTFCTQNILSGIAGNAVQPLTYITDTLQKNAGSMQGSIQSIRAMFDKVRSSMQDVSQEIMGRLMNVMTPLMEIIISFKDLTSKIQGTMTAGLFTLLGSYYALKSLMGAIAQFITTILIAIAAMVAIFWAVPFTWGAAVANTAIFVAISIPMAIILSFMTDVLHVNSGYKIPRIKCFDKDTSIAMNDGSRKKIIDIEVGDILSNNNAVTAKFKVATEGSEMYLLDNIIVSDSHIVKYNNQWMPVSKHPYAVKCDSYNEPFLYCLNTTYKVIEINNHIFTDWDEIYEDSLYTVLNNDEFPLNSCKDIHKYLDWGFSETTKICLVNGKYVEINKIAINDVLENGETVYGIVEIDGLDIAENNLYNLGKNSFGIVEGYIPDQSIDKQPIPNTNHKLYHLLTDKKTFKLGNTIIPDYNAAIDRFLEIPM
jgi:hypothetical protein